MLKRLTALQLPKPLPNGLHWWYHSLRRWQEEPEGQARR